MIEIKEEKSSSLIKAEKQLQKATNRLKEEKKKANEEKRKQDNHNKIIMGGIVKKYFLIAFILNSMSLNSLNIPLMNTNIMLWAGHLYLPQQKYYSTTERNWRG